MKESNWPTPDQVFGKFFELVQLSHIFPDSKGFADATPKYEPDEILEKYAQQKENQNFDLKTFVLNHFEMPDSFSSGFKSDSKRSAEEHVQVLWPYLTRRGSSKTPEGSSLIPIPHDYIVPGGRFGEIYYWDSYFTMLGLAVSGEVEMIRNMVQNFAHFIETLGHIPNGNRSYFLSRSQPPFYSLMVQLLAELEGNSVLGEFKASLEKEYSFWMEGAEELADYSVHRRTVRIGNHRLNRYWDDQNTPRQEMYGEDVELAEENKHREPKKLYRDIRAACESGWDFTSRWLDDGISLGKIEASDIIPVDLNCLLWNLENLLSEIYQNSDNKISNHYRSLAEKRKEAINTYCWNPERNRYEDYHIRNRNCTGRISMATCFPLFFKLANNEQAASTAKLIQGTLLSEGGLLSTPYETGQQWDAPNGWAPLQWMGVKALDNYGFKDLAHEVASRWCHLCERVYQNTGKFVEKYNVVDMDLLAGGGEYPVQDGFGWSNGVYLKLKDYLRNPSV